MNNTTNQTGRLIELSLEELTTKLKNDLKLVSTGDTFAQMLKCISYTDNQLNVDTVNVIPEYMTFRDKSISVEKEVLVNSLFYYMFVHKSVVKSSQRNKVDLKILQDNPLVMNSEINWSGKSYANTKQSESSNNFKRNLQNFNLNEQENNDFSYHSSLSNLNPREKIPRKISDYLPEHSTKKREEEVVMSGRINMVDKTNIDVGTMLFGGLEKPTGNNPNENRNLLNDQKRSQNLTSRDDRSRSKSPLPQARKENFTDDRLSRDKSIDRGRSKSPLPRVRTEMDVDDMDPREKNLNINRTPNRSEKTIDLNKTRIALNLDAVNQHDLIQRKKSNLNTSSIQDERKNKQDMERDRSKSPLKLPEIRPSDSKKDFLNRKRSSEEKEDFLFNMVDPKNPKNTKKRCKDLDEYPAGNEKSVIRYFNIF